MERTADVLLMLTPVAAKPINLSHVHFKAGAGLTAEMTKCLPSKSGIRMR